MGIEKLDKIFNPKSVAVIGATTKKGTVGHSIIYNVLKQGFKGPIYPINPKRKSILGLKAYPSVTLLKDKIDLAVIATPSPTVPAIVEECGASGVGGIVIISAGFKEMGEQGQKLCDQIIAIARKYHIRIIGPNCLGFIRPSLKLNASFSTKMALPGKIAFISQSGALATAILDWSVKEQVGFSHFVSIGSMIDVTFHDLIDYFGKDPEIKSILIYMESITNARKFMSAARAYARTKPIILLKVGKSSEGAKAIMSHTGSVTSNDAVFDAAFRRAGVLRVNTVEELFDCAETLAKQEIPKGNRIAVLTNAGGPGVIATDAIIDKAGKIAELSSDTMKKLNGVLPAAWSRSNPVDVLGDADETRYKAAMEIVLQDPNVDGILVILTPQSMTNSEAVAKAITSAPNPHKKTILASWMGEDDVKKGVAFLEKSSIPVFRTPEDAITCFMNIYNYSRNIELLYETPTTCHEKFEPKKESARRLLNSIIKECRYTLTEQESKEIMSYYGIPVAQHAIAGNMAEAGKLSSELGFPVAMKILSPDILHKTDAGGVELNIQDKKQAELAYSKIISSAKKYNPKAKIMGVFMEKMYSKKYELLIGAKKDPIFGPIIVFGMGGVTVELYKDINQALPPLNMALAKRLMEKTKVYTLLKGYRGMKGANIDELCNLLCKFSYLLMDFPELKEVDINPLAVDENGSVVLDAKIVLDKDVSGKKMEQYSHLAILPYPKDMEKVVKLKNGKSMLLRPIKPEDEPMEAEMFTHLSKRTQLCRFFKPLKEITHSHLIRYTQIDYDREIAIIAEIEERGVKKMAGVARVMRDPFSQKAEFGVVVADPWQKQGIGSKLVDYIIEISKKKGFRRLYIDMLPNNTQFIKMLKNRHFQFRKKETLLHAWIDW